MKMLKSCLTLLILTAVSFVFAFGDVVIENSRRQTVFYYSEGLMYRGGSAQGKPIFMFNPNDQSIYPGTGALALGAPLATWKNDALYPVNRTNDPPIYIYRNHGIHTPASGSVAVNYLEGTKLYEGANNAGQVKYYFSAPLPIPAAVYLLTVKDEAPALPVVYAGLPDQGGKPLLCLQENRIYRGNTAEGDPLYTMDPHTMKFYRGARIVEGRAEYTIGRDNKVYMGDGCDDPAKVVMSVSGYSFYPGGKTGGEALASFAAERPMFSKLYKGFLKKGDKPNSAPIIVLPDGISIAAKFFLIYKIVCEPAHPEKRPAQKAASAPIQKPVPKAATAVPATKPAVKPVPAQEITTAPVQKTKTTPVSESAKKNTPVQKTKTTQKAQKKSVSTQKSSEQKKKQKKTKQAEPVKKPAPQPAADDGDWY